MISIFILRATLDQRNSGYFLLVLKKRFQQKASKVIQAFIKK